MTKTKKELTQRKKSEYKRISEIRKKLYEEEISPVMKEYQEFAKQQKEKNREVSKCFKCGGELVVSRGFVVCRECGLCVGTVLYGSAFAPFSPEETKLIEEGAIAPSELSRTSKLIQMRYPYSFKVAKKDVPKSEKKKYDRWQRKTLNKEQQRMFMYLEDFLKHLKLNKKQTLNIKDYVMQKKPQSYKETLIFAMNYINKSNLPTTPQEQYNAIKGQRFKQEIMKEISVPKRDYTWVVLRTISEERSDLSDEEQFMLSKEYISRYKDINKYDPEVIKKRVKNFIKKSEK